MAKPIAFGNYHFKTKKSATEEARRRINQYETGERLLLEDELFFTSLFTLHPEYKEKKGAGIHHLKVERDFSNNRCLHIHRIDGTSVDCSWVHCIQPASLKMVVSMAFRRAVKDIIISYKKSELVNVHVCPVFGTKLTINNSHVSYLNPSFDELLMNFLTKHQIDVESVEIVSPESSDHDQRGVVADSILLETWRSYHKSNAHLQLLSAEANLRKIKAY
ncbi:DCL family protein [Salinicola halophyticus]|uniref:DCL family protein n=1 Tax=Salinicola halophyticus TaxID=1808881 RepID=UPI000DA24EB7|nr:DCL family protein [Salinicola halophyticus]